MAVPGGMPTKPKRKPTGTRGHGPPPPPKPTLGAIPTLEAAPGQAAAQKAGRKAQAAKPAPVLPQIPIIRNPTPAQTTAAHKVITHAVVQHAKRTGQTPQEATADLRSDPRARRFVSAAAHYAQIGERQTSQMIGRAMGVRGASAQVRAGRQLSAWQAQRDQVHPGKAPAKAHIGIGPAAITLPIGAAAKAAGRAVDSATSLNAGDLGPRQAFKKVAADFTSLGTFPFIAGYETGAGVADVVQGRGTGRLQHEAVGVAKGLYDEVRHPIKFAGEHPGLAALTFAGGVGALGRVGGLAARTARADIGSTVRPPLVLGEDANASLVHRDYSKDITRAAVQRSNDARRAPLLDRQGNPVTTPIGGREVPVLKARPRERERLLKGEANFRLARANAEERKVRDAVSHEFKVRGIKGRGAKDLVSMAVEGTITSPEHFVADLTRHGQRIADALAAERANPGSVFRHPDEVKLAEHRLGVVRKALEDPKVLAQADRIVSTGADIGRRLNEAEGKAVRLGILNPKRAARSRLVVPAVEHMGARHFTPDELKALGAEGGGPVTAESLAGAMHSVRDAKTGAHLANAKSGQFGERLVVRADIMRDGTKIGNVSRFYDPKTNTLIKEITNVDKAHQRQGIASRLATAEEQAVARLGVSHVEVVPGSPAGAALSARVGGWQVKEGTHGQRLTKELQRPDPISNKALEHGALRHADGRFLSNAHVEEALRAKGRDPATVAYLPHRYDVRGARAFHTQFRPGSRPLIDKAGVRTGTLYERGGTEASPELIREQAVRLATQITKTGHIDQMIGELGLKHPSGRHYTGKEATEFADRLERTTGERLTPVRAFPAKAGKKTEQIAKGEQRTARMETLQESLLNKRLKVDAGAKNVVLVPTAVIEQAMAHLKPAGTIEKFFQAVNPAFRLAVLPQFRWLTGNFVEPWLIRLPIEGTGLINIPGMALDLRATSKILKTMRESKDPKERRAAEVLEAQQIGQGLFIGGRGASVRRELKDFGKAGQAAAFFRNLPVMKEATDLFLMLPHTFFAMNRVIESGAQRVAFGRLARRELRGFTGSWMKTVFLQRQAMEDLAKGLTDTPTQRKLMKAQHRILGQYEGFNPTLRRWVQSATPFIPWYLNALRLVYWTMPVHHTTLTAVAVQTGRLYDQDWQQMHKNLPPGSLRMAIPTKDGGWVDLARYTPWGATEEQLGGAVTWQSLLNQFAPQFSGAAAALADTDPFGRKLQFPKDVAHPKGEATSPWELLPVAANQLAGSLIPGYSTAQRLREGGGTALATSTPFSPKTKPGSKTTSGVNRTLNPLRPTYLKTPGRTPQVIEPTATSSTPADRLTELRRQAAQRRAAPSASADRLMELRRAAAARRVR